MRKLKTRKDFVPAEINHNDEIFPNGIFVFNITKMKEYIMKYADEISLERIDVSEYRDRTFSVITESHVDSVDITIPIILAELCPGRYSVIDGHHRLEKAYRSNAERIMAYKLTPKQFIPFFTTVKGYEAFIEYWNSKLKRGDY
jgi:hypothetical protein